MSCTTAEVSCAVLHLLSVVSACDATAGLNLLRSEANKYFKMLWHTKKVIDVMTHDKQDQISD